DNVFLNFEDSAIDEIAKIAFAKNESGEDIGARRLHAVFEEVLEDISFHAGGDNMPRVELNITADYVKQHLESAKELVDIRKYIL
ncbi:MAG: HslU--HslV peptidase ATPase subunit, partial [Christensenellaceae bacterium]|nr:HslU--HslV peptidase ATPase subunit [Christensenellaceae bacterium]